MNAYEHEILKALGVFRYLTISQFEEVLNQSISKTYIWKLLKVLIDGRKPFVAKMTFERKYRFGSLEDIYYLTEKGANTLQEFDCNLNPYFPKGKPNFKIDYVHRTTLIDFQIKLTSWTNESNNKIAYFKPYFVKAKHGDRFKEKTKIILNSGDSIIPDGVFLLKTGGKEKLFMVEVHMGNVKKRLLDQIYQHAIALTSRKGHETFAYPKSKPYNILLIFEKVSILKKTIEYFQHQGEAYKNIQHYYLCKTIDEVRNEDFEYYWKSLFGKSTNIKLD